MATNWTLSGITSGRSACDHCGRTLSRLFRVTSPEGVQMVVGRTCSAKLTGYNWNVAQAERIERIRQAEELAAATYGNLWTALRAKARETAEYAGTAGAAGEGVLVLRDRPGYMTETERIEFAHRMLAA